MYKTRFYAGALAVVLAVLSLTGCTQVADTNTPALQDEAPPAVTANEIAPPNEEEEEAVLVQYGIVGSGDMAFGQATNARFGFSLLLPEEWPVAHDSENGDGFFIDTGTDVDMRAYGEHMVLDPDHYRTNWDNMGELNPFTFIDDAQGYTLSAETIIFYLRTEGDVLMAFYVDYAGDPNWYEDHRDLIDLIAFTLVPTAH